MRKIGFLGASVLNELGPVADVVLFFDCINAYPVKKYPKKNWNLVTDKLYRKYLNINEFDESLKLMNLVKEVFKKCPTKTSVNWNNIFVKYDIKTNLDISQKNLYLVFYKYFDFLEVACNSAVVFSKKFNSIETVRIIISDIPQLIMERKRPLSEYDAIEGKPFWLR